MVRAPTSFFEWKWENDFQTYCPWMQYFTAVKIVSAVYVDVVYPGKFMKAIQVTMDRLFLYDSEWLAFS